MGTPDIAVKSLEKLNEKFEVIAVVTQPDRPKGRGNKKQRDKKDRDREIENIQKTEWQI